MEARHTTKDDYNITPADIAGMRNKQQNSIEQALEAARQEGRAEVIMKMRKAGMTEKRIGAILNDIYEEIYEYTNEKGEKRSTRFVFDNSEEAVLRDMLRMREKALHDEATAIAEATRKGFEEGKAMGRAEVDALAARNMRAMGMTEEQIEAALK